MVCCKETAWSHYIVDGFFDLSNIPQEDLDYMKEIFFEGFTNPQESRYQELLHDPHKWPVRNAFGQDDTLHIVNVYNAAGNYAREGIY